jgi:two-component sensor histidine kinase
MAQDNFVNLGRRSQNLLSRQMQLIEKAEQGEDDPEALSTLFKIDHLAARMRRNAESLLVIADRPAPRKRRAPVSLDSVLRAATSEIEQYQRVQVPNTEVEVDGQYAPELVHLFAELLENAVRFSSPDTDVTVNIVPGMDAMTVEIVDSGIGLPADELDEANERLTGQVAVKDANYLGLFVVGRLSNRLGATVRLERRTGVGITAVVSLPSDVLADRDTGLDLRSRPQVAPAAPAAPERAPRPQASPAVAPLAPAAPTAVPQPQPQPEIGQPEVAQPTVDPVSAANLDDVLGLASTIEAARPSSLATPDLPPPTNGLVELPKPGTALTAESFGLRKRQSGSSLQKTQRASARTDAPATPARDAAQVRNRFSSFAAGKQQAQIVTPQTSPAPADEENS